MAPPPLAAARTGGATRSAALEAARRAPGSGWSADLAAPLAEVTFVVLDLETTGASPATDRITEVGAVKYRGGARLGTFATLVDPGVAVPPTITALTGITEAMVRSGPRIEAVLPHLLEFVGDAVVVGHNVRFDLAFLGAALSRQSYPLLDNPQVDTLALARRLVRDEVSDLRLATLARYLRAATAPCHRAFADAAATADVLHALLERAGTLGVLALDDLLALPSLRLAAAGKLRLAAVLPRAPGVYVFRDRQGRALHVGTALSLRAGVRAYFGGDRGREVDRMLRRTEVVEYVACDPLEAEVRGLRSVRALAPVFDRAGSRAARRAYVQLTDERFPRLSVTRAARAGATAIGPFASRRAAEVAREAIERALPLRRCHRRVPWRHEPERGEPCIPAQRGDATCPCRGQVDDDTYAGIVERLRRGLAREPALLLEPLAARMLALAADARYEEAAATRVRLESLVASLQQGRLVATLAACARVVVEIGGARVELAHGRLALDDGPGARADGPEFDEVLLAARWLGREAERIRLLHVDGVLASPWPGVADYGPESLATGSARG